MSVSLYRWNESCDGQPCPGDCDSCTRNTEDEEEDDDNGHIGKQNI